MIAELAQLGAKAETTEGTYNAPLAADASHLVRNPTWELVNPKTERDIRHAGLSRYPGVGRAMGAQLAFELDLYAQNQTSLPAWMTLAKACGFNTITGGGGSAAHVIKLKSDSILADIPPVSISINVNGYVRKMAGCRGNMKIKAKAGGQIMGEFTFMGAHVAPTDTAFLSPTFDTNIGDLPTFLTAGVRLNAVSPATASLSTTEAVLEGFELDLGNELFLRPSANSATGFLSCVIANREPKLIIDPEWTTVAAFDWLAQLQNDYSFDFTTGQLNGWTALNNIKIDAPKCQAWGVREQNRGGVLVAQAELRPRLNSVDGDEISITLSA